MSAVHPSTASFWFNRETNVCHIACGCGADLGPKPDEETWQRKIECASCGAKYRFQREKAGYTLQYDGEQSPEVMQMLQRVNARLHWQGAELDRILAEANALEGDERERVLGQLDDLDARFEREFPLDL